MHPVEFSFYKFIVLLAAVASIGIGITNIVYFNKIRLGDKCSEISPGTATTLLWLNIIVVVLSAVAFFWSMFRIIFTGEPEKQEINTTYNEHVHEYENMQPVTNNDNTNCLGFVNSAWEKAKMEADSGVKTVDQAYADAEDAIRQVCPALAPSPVHSSTVTVQKL